MAKVKLNLSTLTTTEKVQLARTIVTAMTGNATYATPVPSLASLTADADDLETKDNDREVKSLAAQAATSLLHDAEAALDKRLAQMGNYVEVASDGDEAQILSAGMSVRAPRTPVGSLPAVQSLAATSGDQPGECDLIWQPILKAKNYVVEKSPDPITPTSWQQVGFSSKSRFTVTGLTSGTKYWFRVAALGTGDPGPWSDPATAMSP